MRSKEGYIDLLPEYFAGFLNSTDRLAVEEWKDASDENLAIFRESEKVYHSLDLLKEMRQYDSSQALQKLNDRISREKPVRNFVYYWQRIAAVLLLPLLLGSLYLFVDRPRQSDAIWQAYHTPPGVKSELRLPDGTSIILNSETKIEYPSNFTTKERRVVLSGEAFFDVAKDKARPFIVDLGKIGVEVLGTKFNVSNYPDESRTEVVLAEGKVNLIENDRNRQKILAKMNSGEQVVFEKQTGKLFLEEVEVDRYISWIDGLLIFREDNMEKVVRSLERWYKVDITIETPEIKDYIFTGTFKQETIIQILDLLKRTSPIDYRIVQSEKLKNGTYGKQRIILTKSN
ncbi:FecR family protein [Mangrovibacterium sp.]|uniref:FecR family protein n=1 Tax=Mangrovibacterium sp. TaxID=1961364 RepID=UPI00356ABA63